MESKKIQTSTDESIIQFPAIQQIIIVGDVQKPVKKKPEVIRGSSISNVLENIKRK